jgi:hypothetical protein
LIITKPRTGYNGHAQVLSKGFLFIYASRCFWRGFHSEEGASKGLERTRGGRSAHLVQNVVLVPFLGDIRLLWIAEGHKNLTGIKTEAGGIMFSYLFNDVQEARLYLSKRQRSL